MCLTHLKLYYPYITRMHVRDVLSLDLVLTQCSHLGLFSYVCSGSSQNCRIQGVTHLASKKHIFLATNN